MRFQDLTLANVGVFGGEQRLNLLAKSERRPIILVGGLNGGGKTTILTSILLVFYGKLSPAFRETGTSYEQYLREMTTRKTEGESVIELRFRHRDEKGDRLYTITRGWVSKSKKVKERFDVMVDGCYDQFLSNHWLESVDQFLPSRLAGLFFFDGEKIEDMANPRKAPGMISSAINSLLGMDIVKQLEADLEILERRRRKSMQPPAEQERISTLETHLKELRNKRDIALQTQAACVDPLTRSQNHLQEAEDKLRDRGGNLAATRDKHKSDLAKVEYQMSTIKDQMQSLAAGPLPLALVRSNLQQILEYGKIQLEANDNKHISQLLKTRDGTIISSLKNLGIKSEALDQVSQVLAKDRKERQSSPNLGPDLELNHGTVQELKHLLNDQLQTEVNTAKELIKEYDSISDQQVKLERLLSAAPEEDTIQPLLDAIRTSQKEVIQLETKHRNATDELNTVEREIGVVENELNRLLRDTRMATVHDDDSRRFVDHSERGRKTLAAFREALTKQHIDRLESLILEGYQSLLHKPSLIAQVRIEPKTCELTLINASGATIPIERLSTGERQLLATSILWGLARASGRPLPVIIDTPLARLDSKHRGNFVKRYLPRASHQTLILSTDEEIIGNYHNMIKPHLAHEYLLKHDDDLGHTKVSEGYFALEASLAN